MRRHTRFAELGLALTAALLLSTARAQTPNSPARTTAAVEKPDAEGARQELSNLLEKYPPALRGVLALDPSLLDNEAYLAPYPALASFLSAHPEIARNPSFFLGDGGRNSQSRESQTLNFWRESFNDLMVFAGFGLAAGVVIWLIRTMVDYRRWSRLAKVQTDAHTKLLDRFTSNEDLLAYIKSPAGSKFLESSPIKLDAGPRNLGAPVGRILWSVQGGLVLIAGGIGLQIVSTRLAEVSEPLHLLGVLGIAIGLGFLASAIISFVISQRLGLIDMPSDSRPAVPPGIEGFGNLK